MTENQKCTKAMASVERRFCGNQKRSAVITQEEFRAISDYIETLEHDLTVLTAVIKVNNEDSVDKSGGVSADKCPGCGGVADNGYDRSWPEPNPYFCTKCDKEETVYIPDKYEQARESLRMRREHLDELRNHKLVMK